LAAGERRARVESSGTLPPSDVGRDNQGVREVGKVFVVTIRSDSGTFLVVLWFSRRIVFAQKYFCANCFQEKFWYQSWYHELKANFPLVKVHVPIVGPIDKFLVPKKAATVPAAATESGAPPAQPANPDFLSNSSHILEDTVVAQASIRKYLAPPVLKTPLFASKWTVVQKKVLGGPSGKFDLVVSGIAPYGREAQNQEWGRLATLSIGPVPELYRPLFLSRVGYGRLDANGIQLTKPSVDSSPCLAVRVPKAQTLEKAKEIYETIAAATEGRGKDNLLHPKYIIENTVLVYLLFDNYIGDVLLTETLLDDFADTPLRRFCDPWTEEMEKKVTGSLTPLELLCCEAYKVKNAFLGSVKAQMKITNSFNLANTVSFKFDAFYVANLLYFDCLPFQEFDPRFDHVPPEFEAPGGFGDSHKWFRDLKGEKPRPFASVLQNFSGPMEANDLSSIVACWIEGANNLSEELLESWGCLPDKDDEEDDDDQEGEGEGLKKGPDASGDGDNEEDE
jgi:hypothetical protein